MSCPVCDAPRGEQRYCWRYGAELPAISVEDLLKFEMRRERHLKLYGGAKTVNGVLRQSKLGGK